MVYAAKFNFESGHPGYVGELFIPKATRSRAMRRSHSSGPRMAVSNS